MEENELNNHYYIVVATEDRYTSLFFKSENPISSVDHIYELEASNGELTKEGAFLEGLDPINIIYFKHLSEEVIEEQKSYIVFFVLDDNIFINKEEFSMFGSLDTRDNVTTLTKTLINELRERGQEFKDIVITGWEEI